MSYPPVPGHQPQNPQPGFGQQPQYGQKPQYGQQQYGAQPLPQQPAATGYLDLTVQGSVWTSSMVAPRVVVNGHALTDAYGRRVVPVPAGPVRVEASAQWMRQYGQATLDVTVAPNQTVPVFYAAPWHQFTTGSIGHVKQSRKGLGVTLAIIVGALVLIPGFFLAMTLLASNA